MQKFRLVPYPANDIPAIEITGKIARVKNQLSIHYLADGETQNILLPKPAARSRKDNLWRATCFEFFLAVPGRPEYWEFNMSPSGEWNAYRMDAYRQVNMREETRIPSLPFEFRRGDDIMLDLSVDLSSIARSGQSLQLGITAIIQTRDGSETYWALSHPGKHADFHVRESFRLEIS